MATDNETINGLTAGELPPKHACLQWLLELFAKYLFLPTASGKQGESGSDGAQGVAGSTPVVTTDLQQDCFDVDEFDTSYVLSAEALVDPNYAPLLQWQLRDANTNEVLPDLVTSDYNGTTKTVRARFDPIGAGGAVLCYSYVRSVVTYPDVLDS